MSIARVLRFWDTVPVHQKKINNSKTRKQGGPRTFHKSKPHRRREHQHTADKQNATSSKSKADNQLTVSGGAGGGEREHVLGNEYPLSSTVSCVLQTDQLYCNIQLLPSKTVGTAASRSSLLAYCRKNLAQSNSNNQPMPEESAKTALTGPCKHRKKYNSK